MDDSLKIIAFSLDDQCYGLPLHTVTKILRAVEVTKIPTTSNFILGVINHHGQILPVIDIRSLIGLHKKPLSLFDHLVMVQIYAKTIIMVVDAVTNIMECTATEISSVESYMAKKGDHVKGILKKDDKLIFILDIEKLLSDHVFKLIDQLIANGSVLT